MSEQPLFQPPWNFFGLPPELSSPSRAKAWVLPIPYESTTSYGAGTPEPDGLSWSALLEIVRTVLGHSARLPAFDVVELAPIPAMPASDFLAGKLVYKIISLSLVGRAGNP